MSKDAKNIEIRYDGEYDSRIAPYVIALQENGIETFESCQGGEGHAFAVPTIRFHGAMGSLMKALGIAQMLDWPVSKISYTYDVIDKLPHGPYCEMIFHL